MAEDTEQRCDICRGDHPAHEFICLPCAFGHSFGKQCFESWLEVLKDDDSDLTCPMCCSPFRYRCGHGIEHDRILTGKRDQMRYELAHSDCLRDRERARNFRRRQYLTHLEGHKVTPQHWPSIGDLEPMWLEEMIPAQHRTDFESRRDELRTTARGYMTATLASTPFVEASGLEEGSERWKGFWERKRLFEDFLRAQNDLKCVFDNSLSPFYRYSWYYPSQHS